MTNEVMIDEVEELEPRIAPQSDASFLDLPIRR
jgi:hypothetical protein